MAAARQAGGTQSESLPMTRPSPFQPPGESQSTPLAPPRRESGVPQDSRPPTAGVPLKRSPKQSNLSVEEDPLDDPGPKVAQRKSTGAASAKANKPKPKPSNAKTEKYTVDLPEPTSPNPSSETSETTEDSGNSVVVGEVDVQLDVPKTEAVAIKKSKKGKGSGSGDSETKSTTPYPTLSDYTKSVSSYQTSSILKKKPEKSYYEYETEDKTDSCGTITKGMGAISFKVPGRITHKTTIRIAHYPQAGNEIISVEQPCPQPGELNCGEEFVEDECADQTCQYASPCGAKAPPGTFSNNCNFSTYNINDPQNQMNAQYQHAMQMHQHMMYHQHCLQQAYRHQYAYASHYCQPTHYPYSYRYC